ncbi:DUF2059 domain-containing protein [Lutibacter holmesii]|uniref:DUF2059 domain-containing protein n=1 Tax=Lutibacter holmesii TaxID=1137985 RepID=A0ABW3WPA0_9FLAO
MKKIILIVVVFLCAFNVNAQEDTSYKTDTEKLVAVISENAFKPYIDQFASMVAAEKQEDFKKEIEATLPGLYSEMAKIYMDQFTHDEILELLKFYATPVGKKMADNSGALTQKGMVAGQTWGIKVQEIISRYQ